MLNYSFNSSIRYVLSTFMQQSTRCIDISTMTFDILVVHDLGVKWSFYPGEMMFDVLASQTAKTAAWIQCLERHWDYIRHTPWQDNMDAHTPRAVLHWQHLKSFQFEIFQSIIKRLRGFQTRWSWRVQCESYHAAVVLRLDYWWGRVGRGRLVLYHRWGDYR